MLYQRSLTMTHRDRGTRLFGRTARGGLLRLWPLNASDTMSGGVPDQSFAFAEPPDITLSLRTLRMETSSFHRVRD